MTLFQILATPIAAFLFVRSIIVLVGGKGPRRWAILAASTWLLGGVFILRPEWTMTIAGLLGIGRGADLLLYVFVILFIVAAFHAHARFRAVDAQLTQIVRHLALSNAAKGTDLPADGARDAASEPPDVTV